MAQQAPPLPFDVKAISGYTARNQNELSLEVGKVYRVLATDGRGVWWQSKSDEGQVGWFPASYTQIIESAPAVVEPVPVSPPVIPQHQQHQAQTQPQPQQHHQPQQHQAQTQQPVVQQQHTVVTPSVAAASVQPKVEVASVPVQPQSAHSNGSHAGSVPSDRGAPLKKNLDPALKPGAPPIKDPCTVTLHLVESVHNTLPAGKPPSFFLYKKAAFGGDPKKIKPLFSISPKAKSGPWKWNEEYSLYIKDAEMDVICLRFCAKNEFKCKGKDLVGEIEFPLRGAVRKFDKPNGIFQWWPLKNGVDKVGEVLLFIEYCDPRPFSGPSDVQHKGHVGLTSGGGFEIRDIPQEWKQLFRVLNIKKKDLENNAQYAQEVFDIMQKAASEGVIPGNDQSTIQNYQHEEVNHATPEVSTPVAVASSVTPVVSKPVHTAATTTPIAQQHSSPAPPPPPAQSTGPKPPAPPPAQLTGPKPPAPPPGPAKPSGGGGPSLLEQIQRGTTLKPAQVKEVQAGKASTGNPLADTLLNAMVKYRGDIEGKDEDGEDDWD